ncbi:MAG: hypothetical protein V1744_06830, partial [Candidatus Altiarchaeota archaeon]
YDEKHKSAVEAAFSDVGGLIDEISGKGVKFSFQDVDFIFADGQRVHGSWVKARRTSGLSYATLTIPLGEKKNLSIHWECNEEGQLAPHPYQASIHERDDSGKIVHSLSKTYPDGKLMTPGGDEDRPITWTHGPLALSDLLAVYDKDGRLPGLVDGKLNEEDMRKVDYAFTYGVDRLIRGLHGRDENEWMNPGKGGFKFIMEKGNVKALKMEDGTEVKAEYWKDERDKLIHLLLRPESAEGEIKKDIKVTWDLKEDGSRGDLDKVTFESYDYWARPQSHTISQNYSTKYGEPFGLIFDRKASMFHKAGRGLGLSREPPVQAMGLIPVDISDFLELYDGNGRLPMPKEGADKEGSTERLTYDSEVYGRFDKAVKNITEAVKGIWALDRHDGIRPSAQSVYFKVGDHAVEGVWYKYNIPENTPNRASGDYAKLAIKLAPGRHLDLTWKLYDDEHNKGILYEVHDVRLSDDTPYIIKPYTLENPIMCRYKSRDVTIDAPTESLTSQDMFRRFDVEDGKWPSSSKEKFDWAYEVGIRALTESVTAAYKDKGVVNGDLVHLNLGPKPMDARWMVEGRRATLTIDFDKDRRMLLAYNVTEDNSLGDFFEVRIKLVDPNPYKRESAMVNRSFDDDAKYVPVKAERMTDEEIMMLESHCVSWNTRRMALLRNHILWCIENSKRVNREPPNMGSILGNLCYISKGIGKDGAWGQDKVVDITLDRKKYEYSEDIREMDAREFLKKYLGYEYKASAWDIGPPRESEPPDRVDLPPDRPGF